MYNQRPITDIFFKRNSKIYPMIHSTFKKNQEQFYLLKFDGGSRGNPGLAGAGAVIYCNTQEIWGGLGANIVLPVSTVQAQCTLTIVIRS